MNVQTSRNSDCLQHSAMSESKDISEMQNAYADQPSSMMVHPDSSEPKKEAKVVPKDALPPIYQKKESMQIN